jgi:hypothetical protein
MTSDTVSAEGIKAQMPHPILTPIFGKPTHKQIKTIICKLLAILMAISCPWGHSKGQLCLLQDPAIYLVCNGEAFNIPHIEPLAYPVIPAGAMTANRKELCTTNAATCKAWNTYKMVLTITRDQFAAAINDVYYAVLDNPTKGLNALNLCTLIMHILNTYAQISQPDLDDNMTNFHSGINSGLPLAIYMRKQKKCQVFATDAGVPISNKTMITTGTKHPLACSNMTLAWCEWKRCPPIDHTWPNWKAQWTAAFAKMRNINRMAAGKTPFGANQAAELEQAQQMASLPDNLADRNHSKEYHYQKPGGHQHNTHQSHYQHPTLHCTNVRHQRPNCSCTDGSCPFDGSPCPPLSLEQHQTCLGQGRVLLDARSQGQGWPHQCHMHIGQYQPSARCNPGKDHEWQHSQHWMPYHSFILHLAGCTSGHSFHHHY